MKPITVVIDKLFSSEYFDDHVVEAGKRIEEEKAEGGEHPQESEDKENTNFTQPNIGAKTQDLGVEYQESGWATFLNVCGVLNLVICLAGLALMADSSGQRYYNALYLMIVGLVASINSFLFAFLVNIFTRIQHNTHQTTILLSKLNDKTESKD